MKWYAPFLHRWRLKHNPEYREAWERYVAWFRQQQELLASIKIIDERVYIDPRTTNAGFKKLRQRLGSGGIKMIERKHDGIVVTL